jgi:hypothetical protein
MPTDIDDNLVTDAFGRAVTTVLEDEPDGLTAVTLRRRIHEHPDHDLEVPMQQLHSWLAVLIRDDRLVYEIDSRRYRLREHVDDPAEVGVDPQRHLMFPEHMVREYAQRGCDQPVTEYGF